MQTATSTVYVTVHRNQNSPRFVGDYRANLDEMDSSGTSVVTLEAKDDDPAVRGCCLLQHHFLSYAHTDI